MSVPSFFYSQLIKRLPYPAGSYADQTIIITGSNVGLGKEAARHFSRLDAKRVILAVRNVAKGEDAKQDIEDSLRNAKSKCKPDIQVWQVDMASYASVEKFAARVNSELDRVDIFIANAGIAAATYETMEGNNSMMTVNVVSTFLLAALVLPKLKETARELGTRPTLTITTSETHQWVGDLITRAATAGELWPLLNDKETVEKHFGIQYPASKLLEVFGVRAIKEQSPAEAFPVTINCVNPGLCNSELGRDMSSVAFRAVKMVLARSSEVGSRNLVAAASLGKESHGAYVSDCAVAQPARFLEKENGKKVQGIFWKELTNKLEGIRPGVARNFL
jgi:NAD(P)-dependent dehydrogenase (short-subunit alcohol dehydrogenase family)